MPKDSSLTEGEEHAVVDKLINGVHDDALNIGHERGKLKPDYTHMFGNKPDLPTVIYYTRRDAGTPKASPKVSVRNGLKPTVCYAKINYLASFLQGR